VRGALGVRCPFIATICLSDSIFTIRIQLAQAWFHQQAGVRRLGIGLPVQAMLGYWRPMGDTLAGVVLLELAGCA